MTDMTENMLINVQMDINVSPEQLPEVIREQVKVMEVLDQRITQAKEKVVAAQQKANEANHKIKIFRKKQSIEDLQVAVLAQSEAIAAEDEAMRISFINQKMLADVSTGLLALGLANLVSNRTVFQRIKDQLQQASEEEVNAHAREELKKIVSQLKAQEDVYSRLERQAKIIEDIQEKILHIETAHQELMERSIKEEVETTPAIVLQESRNVVLPDEPKSKKSVSAFAILTFVLALAAATISIMHVMGYLL
jgi:hypothetical protein